MRPAVPAIVGFELTLSYPAHPGDLFIVSTSLAKPDPRTRRFTRSHVMRGKNVGKFRDDKKWAELPKKLSTKGQAFEAESMSKVICQEKQDDEAARTEGWALVSPRKVASELFMLGLGGDMEPYVLELIHRGKFDRPSLLPPLSADGI